MSQGEEVKGGESERWKVEEVYGPVMRRRRRKEGDEVYQARVNRRSSRGVRVRRRLQRRGGGTTHTPRYYGGNGRGDRGAKDCRRGDWEW